MVDDESQGPVCRFAEADGPAALSVTVAETPTPALFGVLHSRADAVPLRDIGDEAWWWEEPQVRGGTLVLRVGGRAATIRLTGQFAGDLSKQVTTTTGEEVGIPEQTTTTVVDAPGTTQPGDTTEDRIDPSAQEVTAIVLDRLEELGTGAAARLEPLPFQDAGPVTGGTTEPPTPGEAACSALSAQTLAVELEVEPIDVALMPLGERGCTFTGPPGVNITMEVVATGADASALDVGRSMTVDGETVTWEPVPVDGLGDGAVWLEDPTSGTTGELYAIYDGTVVRVASSASKPDRVEDRAIAAMKIAAPVLVGLARQPDQPGQ